MREPTDCSSPKRKGGDSYTKGAAPSAVCSERHDSGWRLTTSPVGKGNGTRFPSVMVPLHICPRGKSQEGSLKLLLRHLVSESKSLKSFRRCFCDPSSFPPCSTSDLCFSLTSTERRARSKPGPAPLSSSREPQSFSEAADTPPH